MSEIISFADRDNFVRNMATIMDGGGLGRPSTASLVLNKTAVGALPVSLTEIMDHLRIDDDEAEQEVVAGMALAACAFIEKRTGWALLPTEYEVLMPGWFGDLRIARGPLRGDAKLSVRTGRNTWTDVPVDDFWATSYGGEFVLRHVPGSAPMPTPWQPQDCVRLSFACGFDSYSDTVPPPASVAGPIEDGLRMVLMMVTGHYYKNREMLGVGGPANGTEVVELGATSLLGVYRRFW